MTKTTPSQAAAERAVDPETRLTPRLASVTGIDAVGVSDIAEDFHEASRLYPGIVEPVALSAGRLSLDPVLHAATGRAVKRYGGRPFHRLPPAVLGEDTLAEVIANRRSRGGESGAELELGALASLLHAGYGVTGVTADASRMLRAAPSGGALYPLELYVIAHRVTGLQQALYHYDPLRHGLEELSSLAFPEAVPPLTPFPEVVGSSAAVIVVCASFWRSRVKYGVRGYRFVLLEAGHVAQNVVLAASALRLPAVPLGGFFDRQVDDLVGLDGIYESSLYLLSIWGPCS